MFGRFDLVSPLVCHINSLPSICLWIDTLYNMSQFPLAARQISSRSKPSSRLPDHRLGTRRNSPLAGFVIIVLPVAANCLMALHLFDARSLDHLLEPFQAGHRSDNPERAESHGFE